MLENENKNNQVESDFSVISKNLQHLELIKSQLEKDLYASNYFFTAEHLNIDNLVTSIQEHLFNNQKLISTIINRVDLNEKHLQRIKNETGEYLQNLSIAIILREWQKVAIRLQFKP